MNSRKMFVHAKINCVSKMHIQQTMLRGNNGTISEHFFFKSMGPNPVPHLSKGRGASKFIHHFRETFPILKSY